MMQKQNKTANLQVLVRVASLTAMDVLLMNYFGIHTQYFKIGFSFVPVALCGMLYGWKWGGRCALCGDLMNCFLGPYGWYPPLTLSAALGGAAYGLFLKGRSDCLPAIVTVVLLHQVGISLLLNTFLLSLLYTTPYFELMLIRLPQVLVMLPVQIVLLRLVGAKRVVSALAEKGGA